MDSTKHAKLNWIPGQLPATYSNATYSFDIGSSRTSPLFPDFDISRSTRRRILRLELLEFWSMISISLINLCRTLLYLTY